MWKSKNRDNTVLTVPVDSIEASANFISHSSANILCNYMQKLEYLENILKCMAIKPRYVEEVIDYLEIDDLYSISYPMTCFCDIPLSKVKYHMNRYGDYGIAFDKNVLTLRNVQPITYININSQYGSDFKEVLQKLLNQDDRPDNKWSFLPDFVLTQLMYSKPIAGKMNKNGKTDTYLFRDECEWRYIPNVIPDDMEYVLTGNRNNDKARLEYSSALALEDNQRSWLKFNTNDIVYLIVPNENEAVKLIKFIRGSNMSESKTRLTNDERNRLISKIEVADKFDKNLA